MLTQRIVRDTLSEAGATLLAEDIRIYWRNLGQQVKTRVERFRMPKTVDHMDGLYCGSTFAVRSDMLNGLPR